VIEDAFGISGTAPAVDMRWAASFITEHSAKKRVEIGYLGEDALGGCYRKINGEVPLDGAMIPFCIEAWVGAKRAAKDDDTDFTVHPLINRSFALAELTGFADSNGCCCGAAVSTFGSSGQSGRNTTSTSASSLPICG
jgi:hypothetical protein